MGNADVLVFKPRRSDENEDNRTVDGAGQDSEAGLIRKYERRIEMPDDLKAEAGGWEAQRQYVHTDCMLLDDVDAVGTNYVLRFQQAAMANLAPKDPAPRISPRKWKGPKAAERMPIDYPEENVDYAETHECLIQFQQERGGLGPILNGAIQDALTLPFSVVKMRTQEDFELDPLGYGRNNDQLDSIARYQRLKRQFDDGIFTDRSPQYFEMVKLNQVMRSVAMDELGDQMRQERTILTQGGQAVLDETGEPRMTGGEDLEARIKEIEANPEALVDTDALPEVAYYKGFTWQQVDQEDFRWDWNIRRPEDFRYAQWMAHRVWMTEDEIGDKWGVQEAQLRTAARVSQDGHKVILKDSADSDPELGGKDPEERFRGSDGDVNNDDIRRGEKLAVWEYWDRVQGRVFRWVAGTGLFLDSFVPAALPRRFFPFHILTFNRVTGKAYGPSDTDLSSPLQDEINRLRTWKSEAQKSAHPRFMVTKGLMRPSEKQRFEQALPYSVTEVERAEDLAKNIFPIVPPVYNEALYNVGPAVLELQQMTGAPAAAIGAGVGSGLATDSAIANQQMGNQTDARRELISAMLADMYEAMAEVNAQIMEPSEVAEIVGPGAAWPEINRQQILAGFAFQAESTLNDAMERGQELKAWLDMSQITAQMGLPLDPVMISKKLLELMGIRENIGRYISVPALMAMIGNQQPGQAPAGGSAPQPAGSPEAQGPMGAAGGAPAGQGFEAAPPTVESLPGPA